MNLDLFNQKFEIFKKFQNEIPGISDAFKVLKNFSEDQNFILLNKPIKNSVVFYNFVKNNLEEYCFETLNNKLHSIYTDNIINNRVILYNELYWILCSILEKNIRKNKFKYKNDYTIHQIIFKLCHGLRLARKKDITKYFVREVLDIYYVQYLEVSAEEFYLLMFDFILDLGKENILGYCADDHSIAFNSKYKKDLTTLIYFSFELMLLGNDERYNTFDLFSNNIEKNLINLYLNYQSSDEERKIFINDLVLSTVIASTTKIISANLGINNIFIENIINGIANKTKT